MGVIGASIAPYAKSNQPRLKRRAASVVIPVQRREGLSYIVNADPHVTTFPTRDGALWLAKFLG